MWKKSKINLRQKLNLKNLFKKTLFYQTEKFGYYFRKIISNTIERINNFYNFCTVLKIAKYQLPFAYEGNFVILTWKYKLFQFKF